MLSSASIILSIDDHFGSTTGKVIITGQEGVDIVATTGKVIITGQEGIEINGPISFTGALDIDNVTNPTGDVTIESVDNDVNINADINGDGSGKVNIRSGSVEALGIAAGDLGLSAEAGIKATGATVTVRASTGELNLTSTAANVDINAETAVTINSASSSVDVTGGAGVSVTATTGDISFTGLSAIGSNAQNINLISILLHIMMSARIHPVQTVDNSNITASFSSFDSAGVSIGTFDGTLITKTLDRHAGVLTITPSSGSVDAPTLTVGDGNVRTVTALGGKNIYVRWGADGAILMTTLEGYTAPVTNTTGDGTYAGTLIAFNNSDVSTTTSFGVAGSTLVLTYTKATNQITVGGTQITAVSGLLEYGGSSVTAVVDAATTNDLVTIKWHASGNIPGQLPGMISVTIS